MSRVKRSGVLAAILGAVVAVLGMFVFEAARFVVSSPAPSIQAVAKPLEAVEVDRGWIRSGSPEFAQAETFRSVDGRTSQGLWSCTGPTTFEWHFEVDETVYVLEGEVKIDYQGKQFTLHPGDTAVFHGGTTATWTVDRYLKKTYTLHNPGPLGRLWRQVAPAA